MRPRSYYIVNAITLYRLVTAPLLLLLALLNWFLVFKWLLAISFFTDAIDGFLASQNKVVSKFGARLDSIADDLTVLVGIIAMVLYQPQFVVEQLPVLIFVFLLFLVQMSMAWLRYGKASSFHTFGAKLAAILQGLFLISFFFIQPLLPLFYAAAIITALQLIEEMILVVLLPTWQVNVKGIYWVLKKRHQQA